MPSVCGLESNGRRRHEVIDVEEKVQKNHPEEDDRSLEAIALLLAEAREAAVSQ